MYEFLFGNSNLIFFIAPAIIAAGIAAAGGVAQGAMTGKMNRKSMRFQEKMFDRTNLYNSPLEQRKRLEAAGLNPNLVYGGSPGGTAGTASQPAKPDFETPPIGDAATNTVNTYYNTRAVQAGIDVNEARAADIRQSTINKGIDAVNKSLSAAHGNLDYKTKSRLYQTTVQTAEERLRNLSVNTQYTSGKNSREERITNETVQRIQNEIKNLKTKGTILNEEAIMKRIDRTLYQNYKVRPQDPIYYRILGQIMQSLNIKL